MPWKQASALLLIATFLFGCGQQTPEQINNQPFDAFVGMSAICYTSLYAFCRFVSFSLKIKSTLRLASYNPTRFASGCRVAGCVISLFMILWWFLAVLPAPVTTTSQRVILVIGLPFHLAVFIICTSLLANLPNKVPQWIDNRRIRREEERRSVLREQAAERERQAKQALLEDHTATQAASLRDHKRRMAAKHIAELVQDANELDGATDDKTVLNSMLRKSAVFLEDTDLAETIRADDALQLELAELLAAMERFNHQDTAPYRRLLRLRA